MDNLKNKLVAHLQSYLRERMDFVASIPTLTPAWTMPLDIIEGIIDPVWGPIREDKCSCPRLFLLLDNIAKSEKIGAGAIALRVRIFQGKSIDKPKQVMYKFEFENSRFNYKKEGLSSGQRDLYKAAIYMGTIGTQAFYGIMENFLRNTTRHSSKKRLDKIKGFSECLAKKEFKNPEKDEVLQIFLDFYFDWTGEYKKFKDDFIKVILYDNLGGWSKGVEKMIPKLDPLNDEGRLVDDQGEIVQKSRGLKEMRICTSFLRGLEISEYEKEHSPSVIKPEKMKYDKSQDRSLGYVFFWPKVKDLLVISKKVVSNNKLKEKLKRSGVFVEENINKVFELRKEGTFTHEFVVIDGDDEGNLEFLKKNIKIFPYKTILLSESKENQKIAFPPATHRKILTITKAEFKGWLGKSDYSLSTDTSTCLSSCGEKIILEVYRTWVNFLLCSEGLPKVGYRNADGDAGEYREDEITYGGEPGTGRGTPEDCKVFSSTFLLDHKWQWYEAISKSCKKPSFYVPFSNSPPDLWTHIKRILQKNFNCYNYEKLKAYFEFLEAGLTNIAIIDERIFADSGKEKTLYDEKVSLGLYWYLQNVLIFNLNLIKENEFLLSKYKIGDYPLLNSNLEVDPRQINKEFKKWGEIFPEKFKGMLHFLVIHQTLIETKIGGKEGFKDFLNLLPDEYKPWYIIVTSGKGGVEEEKKPEGVKFLEFSNLRKFILEDPSKIMVSKMLAGLKEEKKQ